MNQSIIDEALRFKINLKKEYRREVGDAGTQAQVLINNITKFLMEEMIGDCDIKITFEDEFPRIYAVTMINKTENELIKETKEQKERFWNVLESIREIFDTH